MNGTQQDLKIIAAIKKPLEKYLYEKYKDVPLYPLENKEDYLNKLDKELIDTTDILKANFLLPNGKLKRLVFDLSDFKLNEIYKINFDITTDNINDLSTFEHEQVHYKGFDLDDILAAGCIRLVYNKVNDEFCMHLSLKECKITKQMLDVIENILYTTGSMFISFTNNLNYHYYSIKDGNTIKDIKHDINLEYQKFS